MKFERNDPANVVLNMYRRPLLNLMARGAGSFLGAMPYRNLLARSSNTFDIQAAINSAMPGEVVVIPEGTYEVEKPIVMKSGVHVRGNGKESRDTIIRNISKTGNHSMRSCFAFGWFHPTIKYSQTKGGPYEVDLTEIVELKEVLEGNKHIICADPKRSSEWRIGDAIWIAARETFELEAFGVFHEMRTQNTMAVVKSVEASSGKIEIDVAVGWSGAADAIGLVSSKENPEPGQPRWHFVIDAHLSNVHCEGYSIVGAAGAINCSLDVTCDTYHGYWSNTWANGTVRVSGTFEGRAFESKVGASNSRFTFNMKRRKGVQHVDHLFSIGEFQHGCIYEDFEIDAGDWNGPYHAMQIQACLNTVIRNGTISCANSVYPLVFIYGDEGLPPTDFLMENIAIKGGASHCVIVGASSAQRPEAPSGVMKNCKFEVMPKSDQKAIYIIRANGFYVVDSEFSHGSVTAVTGQSKFVIKNTDIGGRVVSQRGLGQ